MNTTSTKIKISRVIPVFHSFLRARTHTHTVGTKWLLSLSLPGLGLSLTNGELIIQISAHAVITEPCREQWATNRTSMGKGFTVYYLNFGFKERLQQKYRRLLSPSNGSLHGDTLPLRPRLLPALFQVILF